jgi:hypothetical protein
MNKFWRKKKRGSITVFLVIAFACFLLAASVLFSAAKSAAGRSAADAALGLAGRSVLSEYDRRLFSDYGILAFRGDGAQIEEDIAYYTDASLNPRGLLYTFFRGGGTHIDALRMNTEDVEVNLKEYSVLDLDNFENQVKGAVLAKWLGQVRSGGAGSASGGAESGETGRTLRNSAVLTSLPSAGYNGPLFPSIAGIADLPKAESVFQEGTTQFLLGEYICSVFSNHLDDPGGGQPSDRFFRNEMEYIIAGKTGDDANYNNVKWRLRAVRFALNNAAILIDSEKQAAIEEIALAVAALTEGSGYAVAKAAVTEAWVTAETRNDLMLLEAGKKVAFLKTSAQWATGDIAKIWAGFTASEAVEPASSSGFSYEDYLRILLFMLDRETKLLRMMDLIQINLKGDYYGDFLLREHYVGFRFQCSVDGEKYAYAEKY